MEKLIQKLKLHNPKLNEDFIRKAYDFYFRTHKGDPYEIGHPLRTAKILVQLKVDEETIIASLLHHALEYGVNIKLIKKEFGGDVLSLVEGITNVSTSKKEITDYDSENIRRVLLAGVKDIRVLLIKLADKLDRGRNLSYLPKEIQKKTASEIMNVYAPIAYRLGIMKIKNELEDLSFRYLYPAQYEELAAKVEEMTKAGEKKINTTKKIIEEELKKNKVLGRVEGRVKHIYSVYRKITDKCYDLDKMYDLIALRIITDTIENCYLILKIVHSIWKPIDGTFKDYISMPKTDSYQSLHTSVIVEGGKPIEFQIRTEEMHEAAVYGITAHWTYKNVKHGSEMDKKLDWLKQILEYEKEAKGKEFIKNLKIDFFSDAINCFTPKGDVITLPKDATPIDFAYAVHSQLGEKCIGATVNGKFISLRTLLNNGDIVEILTAKKHEPSKDWLRFVKSTKAKAKIRQFFNAKKEVVGKGFTSKISEKKELEENLISVESMKKPLLSIAKCCKPAPGDQLKGYMIGKLRVVIHKADCEVLSKSKTKSIKYVKVKWVNKINSIVELKVDGVDRVGLFSEVLNTISSSNIKIDLAKGKPAQEGIIECLFRVFIEDLKQLINLTNKLKKVKGVKKVYISELRR